MHISQSYTVVLAEREVYFRIRHLLLMAVLDQVSCLTKAVIPMISALVAASILTNMYGAAILHS